MCVRRDLSRWCSTLCAWITMVIQISNSDGARQQLCNSGALDQAHI